MKAELSLLRWCHLWACGDLLPSVRQERQNGKHTWKHWRGENSPQGKARDKAAKEKEDVITSTAAVQAASSSQLALCMPSAILANIQPSLPKTTDPNTFLEALQQDSSGDCHSGCLLVQWARCHISISPPCVYPGFMGLSNSHHSLCHAVVRLPTWETCHQLMQSRGKSNETWLLQPGKWYDPKMLLREQPKSKVPLQEKIPRTSMGGGWAPRGPFSTLKEHTMGLFFYY